MVASPTRSIVVRGLRFTVGAVLRTAVQRLPPRVQRLGRRAVSPLAKRWPTLGTLLGMTAVPARPEPASAPFARERAAHVEAPEPRPDGWLRHLRSDPDSAERLRAVRAVADRRDPEVATALVAALRDASAEVAAEAAEALGLQEPAVVLPALRAVVDNADGFFNTLVRAAAIRMLSTMLPRGEGAPIARAVSDVHAEVSIAAIAGLVDRREEACTDALIEVIENPGGFYLDLTRSAAARGLRDLTEAQKARLRALTETERNPAMRDLLAELLRLEDTPLKSA